MTFQRPVIGYLTAVGGVRPKNRVFKQLAGLRPDTLICVIEGTVRVYNENVSVKANAGEFIYIPANTASTTFFEDDTNKYINYFFTLTDGGISEKIVKFKGNMKTADIVMSAVYLSDNRISNELLHYVHLYSLLNEFQYQPFSNPQYNKLIPAIKYINDHPERELKIGEYAKMVYMSETSFRMKFKELTRKSPTQYRIEKRLNIAKNLILSGETVENAALKAGFRNVSFYYRCLRNNRAQGYGLFLSKEV